MSNRKSAVRRSVQQNPMQVLSDAGAFNAVLPNGLSIHCPKTFCEWTKTASDYYYSVEAGELRVMTDKLESEAPHVMTLTLPVGTIIRDLRRQVIVVL